MRGAARVLNTLGSTRGPAGSRRCERRCGIARGRTSFAPTDGRPRGPALQWEASQPRGWKRGGRRGTARGLTASLGTRAGWEPALREKARERSRTRLLHLGRGPALGRRCGQVCPRRVRAGPTAGRWSGAGTGGVEMAAAAAAVAGETSYRCGRRGRAREHTQAAAPPTARTGLSPSACSPPCGPTRPPRSPFRQCRRPAGGAGPGGPACTVTPSIPAPPPPLPPPCGGRDARGRQGPAPPDRRTAPRTRGARSLRRRRARPGVPAAIRRRSRAHPRARCLWRPAARRRPAPGPAGRRRIVVDGCLG